MSFRRTLRLGLASAALMAAAVTGALAGSAGIAGSATAVPVITGTSTSSGSPALPTYTDQQIVQVSAPANTTFTAGQSLNILECADPGGTVGNLPTSDSTCDGNTIDGDNIVVASGGSFNDQAGVAGNSGYQLYLLPSAALSEGSSGQPKCDATDACVLYIGTNQNDFTQPHVFSAPFYMAASGPPPVTPETPYALILPLAAGGVVVGAVLFTTIRRRRRTVEA